MKIRRGSISFALLCALEKATKDGLLENLSYSAQIRYLRSLSQLSSTDKYYISKSIRKFIERGLVEYEESKSGERELKLSQMGLEAIGFDSAWDGVYRVVIWDIPESKRRLRDLLRRKLKDSEFVSIQKSVWVSKRNVTSQLRELIVELEMENWVTVIESTDMVLSDIKFHDRG